MNNTNVHASGLLKSEPDNLQRFSHALAHDLGAPLRAIVKFTPLPKKHMDQRLDDKERHWMVLCDRIVLLNGGQIGLQHSALGGLSARITLPCKYYGEAIDV